MPFYDYFCPKNGQTIEVKHDTKTRLKTWEEVCRLAGIDVGKTPAAAKVERLISSPQLGASKATGDSRLKELGFTKLVKKEKGVYENLTATGTEKKIVKIDDPKTYPQLHKKIKD